MKRYFWCWIFVALITLITDQAWAGSVLSDKDVHLYQQIFDLQSRGLFQKADKLRFQVQNPVLEGYVLYDRYFAKGYHTKKSEITAWIKKYNSLAVAGEVYALGRQKKAALPVQPTNLFGSRSGTCSGVFRPEPIDLIRDKSFSYLSAPRRKQAKKIMHQIYRYINRGKTLSARKLVESPQAANLFSYEDHDSARTALAFSYFIDGEDAKGLAFIRPVLEHSGDKIPQAYWVAGLLSWRTGNYADAHRYFATAADHPKTYPLLQAAASLWAARSALKQGDFDHVAPYLEKAAAYPRLFYGIVAMRMLARDLNHVWDEPALPSDDVSADFSHPTLERFYALDQVGKTDWATRELSKLYLEADDEGKGILMLISQQNGFDDDLRALTGKIENSNLRYPAPNWTPTDGWKIDKALVYAFVRQESCFNRRAESSVGALGLMQLMPATARELARTMSYPFKKQLLKEPEYNLSLGQNYLLKLMQNPEIGENLIFLAVAYNAGPGNLAKWKKRMRCEDPMLFLESIPSRETRSFVERIIVNYWIYRNLMGQPLADLDMVATGQWPNYRSFECSPTTVAE